MDIARHEEQRGARQAYQLGLCASNLAVREAHDAGITEKATLDIIGMNAGWAAMATVGCEMPACVAEQIHHYYNQSTAPIVAV